MPADMTQILDAIEGVIHGLYPEIQILQSKRIAAGPPGDSGWNLGSKSTAFVISGDESEKVDENGVFEEVSVGYSVMIEYIKPAEQKVDDQPGRPPRIVEDSDIRDKRQAIRRALYQPLLPGLMTVGVVNRPATPYETTGGNTLFSSGQVFEFEIYENRLGNS